MLPRLLAFEDRIPAAGDFNYMDVRRAWLPDEQRWSLRNYWMGANADLPGALWLLYLQTGRPEVLLAARRNLRHLISMDICHDATPALTAHADPRRRKIVGAFGDHKTPVHWQSTCRVSDRHARIRAPLLAYYLTGDLLARDTALLWAEAAKNYGPATAGEDGLAYLDNLSEILALAYDPALRRAVQRVRRLPFPDAAGPLADRPLDSRIARILRATGDPRAYAYLQRLGDALKADARPETPPARPLARPLRRHRRSRLPDQAQSDRRLREIRWQQPREPDDAPLCSWDDFCAYVFNAGEKARPSPPPGSSRILGTAPSW